MPDDCGRGGTNLDTHLAETVLESLGVEIGDEPEIAELTPRGLVRIEDDELVRLTGVRAGRQVEIRFAAGAMVTWLRAAVPDIQALGNGSGRFVVDAGAPAAGLAVLTSLGGVQEIWRDVRVRGGAEGLVALRRSGSAGHLYDLWLLERLADALDAIALEPLDVESLAAPYRSA